MGVAERVVRRQRAGRAQAPAGVAEKGLGVPPETSSCRAIATIGVRALRSANDTVSYGTAPVSASEDAVDLRELFGLEPSARERADRILDV